MAHVSLLVDQPDERIGVADVLAKLLEKGLDPGVDLRVDRRRGGLPLLVVQQAHRGSRCGAVGQRAPPLLVASLVARRTQDGGGGAKPCSCLL